MYSHLGPLLGFAWDPVNGGTRGGTYRVFCAMYPFLSFFIYFMAQNNISVIFLCLLMFVLSSPGTFQKNNITLKGLHRLNKK